MKKIHCGASDKKRTAAFAAVIILLSLLLCGCGDGTDSGQPPVSPADVPEQTGFIETLGDSAWYGFVGDRIEPTVTISADGSVHSERIASFFFGEQAAGAQLRLYENEDGSCGLIAQLGDTVYDIPAGTTHTDTRVTHFYVNNIQMLLYFGDPAVSSSPYCEFHFRIDTGVNASLSDSVAGSWTDGYNHFVFSDDVDESGFGSMTWNDDIGLWATVGDNLIILIADNETDLPQIFAAVAQDGVLYLSRWEAAEGEVIWLESAYHREG